ncbi:hypothetical protein C7Y66_07150 [Chroococcidiopsis sp. CCALA 051]|uniref:hypothetical protein n=1 Tax=Chroococcidiopsis sp. CCALA 051 TaxID=869949 RepID=UPI000D0D94FE|nr:hypothetical protein [Chroococcidiopsis sp. CCALA 051]MBE9018739.1 hypothetical protein [Chroococcidiopsidales cyanobacterium LEGE 13417]PSM49856.1 hypothetical protein C7Y66_07150 [Chroococcidiopsis sp. CCALA 051]
MKLSLQVQKLTHLTGTFTVIVFCLGSVVLIQHNRLQLKHSPLTKVEYVRQEQTEKIGLDVLKNLPSFGFSNLLGDWIYLRFIQYFGDSEVREKIGYSLSPEYFEGVVDRNPRLVEAYRFLTPATSIFAGQPQKSVALLGKALQSISPEMSYMSYYIWVYKGVDEMLFLGDTKAAQESYQTAAEWAEKINTPDAQRIAASTRQTAAFLAKNPKSKISRIGAWALVLSSTPHEKTQQQAISQIKALGGKIVTRADGGFKVIAPKE